MTSPHTYTIEEEERQMLLLALAKLSLERPGWLDALERTAVKFDGGAMFKSFRTLHDGVDVSGQG